MKALSLNPNRSSLSVQLRHGGELATETVVLAIGNFPPSNLKVPGLTDRSERYVGFPWSHEALQDIPRDGTVLLVGSGLTSLDPAIALKSKGCFGKIHIISRHGLLPQRSLQTGAWPQYWNERSSRTTRGLLQLIRQEVKGASAQGADWRSVIDACGP